MYTMLSFIRFKSKEFTSLICACSLQSKSQKYISRLQTLILKDDYIKYNIHNRRHRDENGKTLPAIVWGNGGQEWYKNGLLHRNDRDENGKTLPAFIYSNGSQYCYINGQECFN